MNENKIEFGSEADFIKKEQVKFRGIEIFIASVVSLLWALYFWAVFDGQYGIIATFAGIGGAVFIHISLIFIGLFLIIIGKRKIGWSILMPVMLLLALVSEYIDIV